MVRLSREFISPANGPGPVRPDPARRHVSNDEFRVTGRQPTFAMGDPNALDEKRFMAT